VSIVVYLELLIPDPEIAYSMRLCRIRV
jgi:hypothetical protein